MFRFFLTGCLLAAMLPAQAGQGFYLGGALGWAMTDIDSATVMERMAAAGIPGTAQVEDEDRLAGKVLAGYGWRYLLLEGAYVHLDTPDSDFQNVGAISVDDLGDVAPASGNGAEVALLARYPFTDHMSLWLRGGLFHWEYSLRAQTRKRFTGTDPTWGAGLEWRSPGPWRMRLGWDRYQVGPDDTDLISLALVRYVGRGPAATDQRVAEPLPEPAPVASPMSPPSAPEPDTAPDTHAFPFTIGVLTFHFGEREPTTTELDQIVTYLDRHSEARVIVRGHTDNQGPEEYNEQLALGRARAVAALLMGQGIAAERLRVSGAGSREPLADNDTPEGRALNRRVDITLPGGDEQ
ncbi:OmpA family protein [Alcanivorax sp. JB21]|uniref:OmpA family protein n=1 Tax=Alcanivorax limicola TaxID=2874102 RepID=UPI001CBB27CF|nr:OmpA family protein [Alcanivorax limicola]MBZ2189929.1 OmpA family protein [Alcanivorax limicola]